MKYSGLVTCDKIQTRYLFTTLLEIYSALQSRSEGLIYFLSLATDKMTSLRKNGESWTLSCLPQVMSLTSVELEAAICQAARSL